MFYYSIFFFGLIQTSTQGHENRLASKPTVREEKTIRDSTYSLFQLQVERN